jgi:hypothetical protein
MNKKIVNVTKEVEFENNDDECLPITKCACGAKFPAWHFYISIYDDDPTICPVCGRKFYFRNAIQVYEVVEEQ